jgi:flagellar biosynthesis protein FlhF
MILKRVTGRSVSEALARLEREIGPDALIVETRHEGGIATVIARANEPAPAPQPEPGQRDPALRRFAPGFRPIAAEMQAFGLSERLTDVVHRACEGLDPHLLAHSSPALPSVVRRVLSGLIPTRTLDAAEHRIVVLVGPTGVGKTTTLAKLAALDVTSGRLRVGVVSTDTYRIAAVEQMRAFTDMLALPFHVAFTPRDLRQALAKLTEVDRVYVDTSGRSPRDEASLRTMRGFFQGLGADVELCLPAGCRRADALRALHAFHEFAPRGLIVTKWDETTMPGEVVSLAVERNMPLSFLTDGQRVPEDIMTADARRIAECVLEDK